MPRDSSQQATEGANANRKALEEKRSARIAVVIVALLFDMLSALIKETYIAWDQVTAIHLDE